MRIIINKLNIWRNNSLNKFLYELRLKIIYLVRNIFGYCRGLLVSFTGKIRYDDSYRPLILGAGTELLVRPGTSIILKNESSDKSEEPYNNNQIFLTATTIGLRPHYLALDPPALNTTRIELLNNAELILDQNTIILSGCYISASNNSKIKIGKNSYISQEVKINSRSSVHIGKNVLIGYQTIIMDYDAHTIFYNEDLEIQTKSNRNNTIKIEDNVWIGAKVTILKGVSIGAGSIIGANSCVASDIPPNTIAVGNPAKIIRKNISWQR